MSPLRKAWLEYEQADFEKSLVGAVDGGPTQAEADAECERAWAEFERVLVDTARKA